MNFLKHGFIYKVGPMNMMFCYLNSFSRQLF